MQEETEYHDTSTGRMNKHSPKLLLGALFLLVIGVSSLLYIAKPSSQQSKPNHTEVLSAVTNSSNVDFPVYTVVSEDLTIDSTSINYSNGLLIYKVQPKNSSVAAVISQQAVPDDLQNSVPASDEQVSTPYGNAAISLQPDRTTAVLIADKSTLISINAPVNFSQDTMKTLLRSLKKYN